MVLLLYTVGQDIFQTISRIIQSISDNVPDDILRKPARGRIYGYYPAGIDRSVILHFFVYRVQYFKGPPFCDLSKEQIFFARFEMILQVWLVEPHRIYQAGIVSYTCTTYRKTSSGFGYDRL